MNTHARAKLSAAGAVTTAGTVAATIFCCLPFASGIIGAGVAAFGARFAPFQPYLATISLALLGHAFYQAYRPDAIVCVGDDGPYDVPTVVRYRRLALWIVAVGVALLLTASWWANWVIYWTL